MEKTESLSKMEKEEFTSDIDQKIEQETQEREVGLIDILKMVSPGSVLRTAIDDISRAGMGALIVVDSRRFKDLIEGGFNVGCQLTSQRIVELAKMDGAIILSSDLRRILAANVVLIPDTRIPTEETGTRHKAAERTAIQASTLVIAISERKKKITLYHSNFKYILQNTEELLSRAVQTLQILEKQREIYDELLSNLNVLEISGLVMVSDIVTILQRIEIIMRTTRMIDRYLIELGNEGIIIKMRIRGLMKGIQEERDFILQDYNIKADILSHLGFDELLDMDSITSALFSSNDKVESKGYRILTKLNLEGEDIEALIKNFRNLNNILNSEKEQLIAVLGGRTEDFLTELASLKEQIMMARKI